MNPAAKIRVHMYVFLAKMMAGFSSSGGGAGTPLGRSAGGALLGSDKSIPPGYRLSMYT